MTARSLPPLSLQNYALPLLITLAFAVLGVSCTSGTSSASSASNAGIHSKLRQGPRSAEHLALIARGYRMAGEETIDSATSSPDEQATPEVAATPVPVVKPDKPGYSHWEEDSADDAAPVRVEIDISDQTASFYRGDVKVGQSRVSTGKPGRETPTGAFKILAKAELRKSNLFGRIVDEYDVVIVPEADVRKDPVPPNCKFVGANMPYWMRLTYSGIGMHAGIIPDPGTASSHGCIRFPLALAERLYDNTKVGTKVAIVP